jgi:hypothetical protein
MMNPLDHEQPGLVTPLALAQRAHLLYLWVAGAGEDGHLGVGGWRLEIGDWGLGIGMWDLLFAS